MFQLGRNQYEIVRTTENTEICFVKITEIISYIPYHWHDGIEILYMISGKQTVMLQKETSIELTAGEFTLINANTLHATASTSDTSFIFINLPYQLLEKYIPNFAFCRYSIDPHTKDPLEQKKLRQFRQLILDMQSAFESKSEYSYLKADSLVFEMLLQLQENFLVESPLSAPTRDIKNHERISRIMEFIYDHYKESVTLSDAAEYVHLKKEYFCRFFKNATGLTFLEFLNSVRIYYAYYDLINTNLSVTQIVEQNGFTSYTTFQKLFRQKFGNTPSEIRKAHRQMQYAYFSVAVPEA